MSRVRSWTWFIAASIDASSTGAEFVLRRLMQAVVDGNLRPTMAAEVAEEARRLLQLDAK